MSKYFVNKDVGQPNPMAVLYHREWIKEIKKALGSKCTFLQHVRQDKLDLKDRLFKGTENVVLPQTLTKEAQYFVEARFKVEGGTKVIKFKIDGTISDVSNENYLNLKEQLIGYARTEGLI